MSTPGLTSPTLCPLLTYISSFQAAAHERRLFVLSRLGPSTARPLTCRAPQAVLHLLFHRCSSFLRLLPHQFSNVAVASFIPSRRVDDHASVSPQLDDVGKDWGESAIRLRRARFYLAARHVSSTLLSYVGVGRNSQPTDGPATPFPSSGRAPDTAMQQAHTRTADQRPRRDRQARRCPGQDERPARGRRARRCRRAQQPRIRASRRSERERSTPSLVPHVDEPAQTLHTSPSPLFCIEDARGRIAQSAPDGPICSPCFDANICSIIRSERTTSYTSSPQAPVRLTTHCLR